MSPRPTSLHLSDENPWPGLDSYTEAAQRFFHGRDLDSAELLRLIRQSPFVLLYGKSGLGKSSMLQAGVFPALREARFLPVYLRLDYTEQAEQPPLQQALGRLLQAIEAVGADAAPPEPGEGLWSYLQRRERPIWTADNFPLTPVLVFDQFEEVFSRGGSPAHIKQVLDAVADLVGDRLTSELAEDPDTAERLNLQSQQYRVVLSFRSDFLAEVEGWERQANLPKHESLHLKAMTRETAVAAVAKAGAAVLEQGVAAQIVDFLLDPADASGGHRATEVEPVLLSLCCYQLNRRREPGALIDSELVQNSGKDILQDFYKEALDGLQPRVSQFIEDHLILGGRYRSSYPRDEAFASGLLTTAELALLTERRLLRVDPQGDVPRIELIHDRLVGLVHDARQARLAQAAQAEELAQTQRRAAELLAESERRAEEERAQERMRVTQERERMARERAREATLSRNRWRWAMGLLAVATSGLVFFALASVREGRAARDNLHRAEALRLGLESLGMLNGSVAGSDERAYQQLLVARGMWPEGEAELPVFEALLARQHLRGFEPVVHQSDSDEQEPMALAFVSGDKPRLVVGHADGTLTLRDPERPHEVLERVPGHTGWVWSVAVSADGQRMVSASEDGTLVRWRVDPLRREGDPIQAHAGAAYSVAISPDGQHFVSGGMDGDDGFVKLWAWDAAGDVAAKEKGPMKRRTVFAVAFHPTEPKIVAVTGVDYGDPRSTASLMTLDAATLVTLDTRYAHSKDALTVAFGPSGRHVATGGADATVRVRRAGDGSEREGGASPAWRKDTAGAVQAVAFSPNGRWLASGDAMGGVQLWDAETGAAVGLPLRGPTAHVTHLAFSPDGRWLVSSSEDLRLHLWPLDVHWAAAADPQRLPARTTRAALAGDGKATLHVTDRDEVVLSDGALPGRPLLDPAGSAPSGAPLRRCATGAAPAGRVSRSLSTAKPEPEGRAPPALAATGTLAASAHADGILRRWRLASGQMDGAAVAVTDCALEAVALSRDGARTAVADSEGNVIVLDAAGKVLEVRPQVDSDPVSALALSADGSQLLVATRGGKLRRYTSGVETPEKIGGVVAPLTALDFSPDDAFLVSGSGGGSVQLWDMRPPGLPRPMSAPEPAHAGGVPTVAFSSDGRSFFSMGLRGDRRTWPAPGTWADRMCEKLVSNLSRKAWAEWVSADDLPYRCACPELPIAPDDPSTPLASGESCPAGG